MGEERGDVFRVLPLHRVSVSQVPIVPFQPLGKSGPEELTV